MWQCAKYRQSLHPAVVLTHPNPSTGCPIMWFVGTVTRVNILKGSGVMHLPEGQAQLDKGKF